MFQNSGQRLEIAKVMMKVKQSLYGPEYALRVPEVWGSQIS
jgi:hypothetical protein